MISFGFSARLWQQIDAGKLITVHRTPTEDCGQEDAGDGSGTGMRNTRLTWRLSGNRVELD
jgi:hypothetical protein